MGIRRIICTVVAISLLLALPSCAWGGASPPDDARTKAKMEVDDRVDRIINSMSLEEKVGQLVQVGFPGKVAGYEAETLVRRHHVGGIILFGRNVDGPAQVASLVNRLQGLATTSGAKVPLMVSADQEGGWVMRVEKGTTLFPGNMALGATRSVDDAYQAGRVMGNELRSMGINMNLAPVVDVNNNPNNPVIAVRSFGEDADWVSKLGAAMVKGLQEAGVMATAKHFPGHGDTSEDSHISLPTVPHDRNRLNKIELAPFRAAIAAGVDAIMTAHVTFPAIDPTPGLPATLSRRVLTGLLRQEMGFKGLIVTDAMEMGAITQNFGLKEAAVQSILAGADVVLVAWPRNWDDAVLVISGLVEAVKAGTISEARIDESVRRILGLKAARGILDKPTVDVKGFQQSLATPSALKLAKKISLDAITVVKNEGNILPLRPEKLGRVLVVSPQLGALTGVEELGSSRSSLGRAIRARHRATDEIVVPIKPKATDRSQVVAAAREADVVIVGTYRAWATPEQAALVQEVAKVGKPLIVVSLREPYDLKQFPAVPVYVATYSATPLSMDALADVLFGKEPPRGKLPVSIPGLFNAGFGQENL